MKLSEAYDRLQWGNPIVFERAGMRTAEVHGHPPVNIGTSAHMLIEMYLDMHEAGRNFVRPSADFLVICQDCQSGQYLRRWLERIHHTLGLNVAPAQDVRFFPLEGGNLEMLRGIKWYSWSVFCDHAVKEDDSLERNTGPYRLVRGVQQFQDHWIARDRDDRQVCRLTKKGVDELIEASTSPITMYTKSPVTYPAYQAEFLNSRVRLKRSFER